MSGVVYPAALREQARAMYEPGVVGYRQVAAALGVPRSTIVRWCNLASEARNREKNRANKARYRGTCVDCGASTSYSGVGTRGSTRCRSCASEQRRVWTRDALIAAVQAWAREHGRPPVVTDWLRATSGAHPSSRGCYGKGAPFVKWADLIEAAGFPRPTSYYVRTPESRRKSSEAMRQVWASRRAAA